MKKYLLTVFILGLTVGTVYSASVAAPQWSEFCPEQYVKAKSSRFNSENNYWYNRRVQFEESSALCNSFSSSERKNICYARIRTAELNKNKIHNSKHTVSK